MAKGLCQIMVKVLLATGKPFYPAARNEFVDALRQHGIETAAVENFNPKDTQMLIDSIPGADILVVRSEKVTEEVIKAADGLGMIVRGGAGLETIDANYASKRGIKVETTPDTNSTSVAELAFDMIGILYRKLNNPSSEFFGREIRGKKLAIYGLGNIGIKTAAIGAAYGAQLLGFDINHDTLYQARQHGVNLAKNLEELFEGADIVSVHVPFRDAARYNGTATENSIDYGLLSRMNPRGVLINTARPGIVNNADLGRLLAEREEFSYGVDALQENAVEVQKWLDQQGLSQFSPRVYATPKIGAQTEEASRRTLKAAAEKILNFCKVPITVSGSNSAQPVQLGSGVDYDALADLEGGVLHKEARTYII